VNIVTNVTRNIKCRPILFSGEMVRAILDGRKTQTRRILKPQPAVLTDDDATKAWLNCGDQRTPRYPYGVPGDRLWVRESFCTCYNGQEAYQVIYSADGSRMDFSYGSNATEDELDWLERSMTTHGERGRPGIHIPRWASRIALEVTGVRVERLQSISEQDAMAEGVNWQDNAGLASYTARKLYAALWDKINGDGAWDKNPWVWVVKFTTVTA